MNWKTGWFFGGITMALFFAILSVWKLDAIAFVFWACCSAILFCIYSWDYWKQKGEGR